jgi:major vault protein
MTQHLRSLVRNKVKKINIEEFNDDAADILRDTILGPAEEGKKRAGKTFAENGMNVYDIEVLNITIGDSDISYYLKDYQKHIVQENLKINKLEKDLVITKRIEEINRQTLEETAKTDDVRATVTKTKVQIANEVEMLKVTASKEKQAILDEISQMSLTVATLNDEHSIAVSREKSEIRTLEYEKQMASIQPKLIEAMITLGGVKTTEILAKNLKEQGGNWTDIFRKGGIEGLLETCKGTPLHDNLMALMTKKIEE